jgi:hypothetical protein
MLIVRYFLIVALLPFATETFAMFLSSLLSEKSSILRIWKSLINRTLKLILFQRNRH